MTPYSLYSLATGELTGMQIQGPAAVRALNTPVGCAWIDGAHDPRRVVVRLVTDDFGTQHPTAAARVPPRPVDSDYQTWAWDEAAGDWAPTMTRRWREAQARAERDRLLAACDWVGVRAYEQGEPVPAPWAAYRAALRNWPDEPGFPDPATLPIPPAA